jgi:hypothetical protein
MRKSLSLGIFEVDGKRQEIKPRMSSGRKGRTSAERKTYITDVTIRRHGRPASAAGPAQAPRRLRRRSEEIREWAGLDRWESFQLERQAGRNTPRSILTYLAHRLQPLEQQPEIEARPERHDNPAHRAARLLGPNHLNSLRPDLGERTWVSSRLSARR